MDLMKAAKQQKLISKSAGQVAIYALDSPVLLYIQVSGYVGPSMLKEVIAFAAGFGRQQAGGWDYVVDSTRLKVANPLNIFWLRRIHNLPNLSKYLVIMPATFPNNLLMPVLSFLVKPDMILDSVESLNRLYDSGRRAG